MSKIFIIRLFIKKGKKFVVWLSDSLRSIFDLPDFERIIERNLGMLGGFEKDQLYGSFVNLEFSLGQ